MRFPRQRMQFSKVHDGKASEKGFIVLNLKGFDLEGVTTLALELGELDECRAGGDKAAQESQRVRDLLGGL